MTACPKNVGAAPTDGAARIAVTVTTCSSPLGFPGTTTTGSVASVGHAASPTSSSLLRVGQSTAADVAIPRHCEQSGVSTDTMTWTSPTIDGLPPPPRMGATATLVGTDIYLFGGSDGKLSLRDMHVLVYVTWSTPQCNL